MQRILLGLLLLVLIIWLFTPKPNLPNFSKPWQVTINAHNHNSVFGITLAETDLLAATKKLAQPFTAGIIYSKNQPTTVEVFYANIKLSGITGKMVLVASVENIAVTENFSILASGTKMLAIKKLPNHSIVQSITFIPRKNLTQDLIYQSFGKPDNIAIGPGGLRHYLYAKIGVDIAINPNGKEVIQYVVPDNFAQITELLQLNKSLKNRQF